MEDVGVFDNQIIHVNGGELGEFSRERDEVNGRAFMELEEVWVTSIIPLPTQPPQNPL